MHNSHYSMFRRLSRDYTIAFTTWRTHMRSGFASLRKSKTPPELAMRTHKRSKHCSLHVRNTSLELAWRTQHYKNVLFQHSLRRADLSHNTNYRATSRLSYGERFSDNSLTYYDKYRASLVLRSWRSRFR